MRNMSRHRQAQPARGVTIVEMMVVVVVAAIILTLAVPSMREFLVRQRVAAVNAELVTDLQFARSEAVARNRDVYVTFRTSPRTGSPPMTCYTIHMGGNALGLCDCRKPPGTTCDVIDELEEIKTVQVLRSTTVTLDPPAHPANQIGFSKTQGLAFWEGHDGTQSNYVSNWADFPVGVESSLSGKLRTSAGITGRPQVCTPDGSFSGVRQCTN